VPAASNNARIEWFGRALLAARQMDGSANDIPKNFFNTHALEIAFAIQAIRYVHQQFAGYAPAARAATTVIADNIIAFLRGAGIISNSYCAVNCTDAAALRFMGGYCPGYYLAHAQFHTQLVAGLAGDARASCRRVNRHLVALSIIGVFVESAHAQAARIVLNGNQTLLDRQMRRVAWYLHSAQCSCPFREEMRDLIAQIAADPQTLNALRVVKSGLIG